MYTALDTGRSDRLGPARLPGRSLAAYCYDELKRRLLVGDFALGRRLAEVSLTDLLGVSRTPVREALSRLHAEGLVLRLPEGGYSPAAPDLHTVSELYEVRRGLEFTALRRGGHDRSRLIDLRNEWAGFDAPTSDGECGPEFVLQDEEFHLGLATAAGNVALVEMLLHVNERIRFVRMQDFLTADRVEKTISEHLGIVEALLDDGAVTAEERLHSHLEISERVVEQRAAIALSRMLGAHRG
jgi:DNA-binding GntR family transcriptional regulator